MENLKKILENKELAAFLRELKKFDDEFCLNMAQKKDFTLKLEVHGNGGKLIHCRLLTDGFTRP